MKTFTVVGVQDLVLSGNILPNAEYLYGRSQEEYRYVINNLNKLRELSWSKHGITPKHKFVEDDLKGLMDDIILTREDIDEWLSGSHGDRIFKRIKRNIANFDEYPERKWTLQIPYSVNTTTITDEVHQGMIRQALNIWEDNTCVTFQELDSIDGLDQQYLYIHGDSDECSSYIGRQDVNASFPQYVNMHPSCFSLIGTAIHEIGHALGLYHEQTRPDRDEYVDVIWDNIEKDKLHNFDIKTSSDVTLGENPYGYNSVMHYGALSFSVDKAANKYTIVPKNPDLVSVIGQQSQLSFYDAKVVNTAYCSDLCSNQLLCQNGGYQDPKNCSQCRCPDEWIGTLCGDNNPGSTGCNPFTGYREHNTEDTDITFYLYSPTSDEFGRIIPGESCFWTLEVPENMFIKFWFGERFGLLVTNSGICLFWVEIRNPSETQAQRYCGYYNDQPPFVYYSKTNKSLVLFQSFSGVTPTPLSDTSAYTIGFKLYYKFSTCANETCEETRCSCEELLDDNQQTHEELCVTRSWCRNNGYPDPDNCGQCICPDGWTGTYCTKLPDNPCSNTIQCYYGGQPDPSDCNRCVCPEEREGNTCLDVATGSEDCSHESGRYVPIKMGSTYARSEGSFTPGKKCFWQMESPENTYMEFSLVNTLGLYKSTEGDCVFWLEIFDPNLDVDTNGRRFCGFQSSTAPVRYRTENNIAFIVFKSFTEDFSTNSTSNFGFTLYFEAVSKSSTTSTIQPTLAPSPTITSTPTLLTSAPTTTEEIESTITISSARTPEVIKSTVTSSSAATPEGTESSVISSSATTPEEVESTITSSSATTQEDIESTVTSSSTTTQEDIESTVTSSSATTPELTESTVTSSSAPTLEEKETTVTSSSAIAPEEIESTVTNSSATTQEEKETTVTSSSAITLEEVESTVTSSSATTQEEKESTVSSSTATTQEEKETTVTSSSAITPEEVESTVTSSSDTTPGDIESTVTSSSATTSEVIESTVTSSSATTSEDIESTVTSNSATTPKDVESTVTSNSATTPEVIESTVTSNSAPTLEVIESTVTSSSATTPEEIESTVTSSSATTPEETENTVTSSNPTTQEDIESTVTSSSATTPEEIESTVTSSSATTPELTESTVTSSSAPTPEEKETTVTSSSAITPEEIESTVTSSSATTQEEKETTVTSSSAITLEEVESTVTSSSATTQEEKESTVSSSTATTQEEKETTVTSSSAITPEEVESTVTCSSDTTPGDIESTVTSSSATISEVIESTVTSSSATTSEDIESTVTSSSATTSEDIESTVTSNSATTPKDVESTVTSSSATTQEDIESTVTSSSATTPEEIESTVSSNSVTTPEDIESTVTSISATTPEETESTVTSSRATTQEEKESTVSSSTATTQEEKETTVTSSSAITPEEVESTVTSSSDTTPGDIESTVTSSTATTSEVIESTVTSSSATTSEDIESTVTSSSATTSEDIESTVTSSSATTSEDIESTVTSNSATTPEVIESTVTSSSATTPEEIESTVTSSSATTPEETENTVTSGNPTTPEEIESTVTSSSATTPEEIESTVTSSSAITPEEIESTVTSSSATTPEEIQSTVTSSSATTPEEIESTVASSSVTTPEEIASTETSSSSITAEYCLPSPCDHGTCQVIGFGYQCLCEAHYTGKLCDFDVRSGVWSQWSVYTICSKTCDYGLQSRQRSCLLEDTCKGDDTEIRVCNSVACPAIPEQSVHGAVAAVTGPTMEEFLQEEDKFLELVSEGVNDYCTNNNAYCCQLLFVTQTNSGSSGIFNIFGTHNVYLANGFPKETGENEIMVQIIGLVLRTELASHCESRSKREATHIYVSRDIMIEAIRQQEDTIDEVLGFHVTVRDADTEDAGLNPAQKIFVAIGVSTAAVILILIVVAVLICLLKNQKHNDPIKKPFNVDYNSGTHSYDNRGFGFTSPIIRGTDHLTKGRNPPLYSHTSTTPSRIDQHRHQRRHGNGTPLKVWYESKFPPKSVTHHLRSSSGNDYSEVLGDGQSVSQNNLSLGLRRDVVGRTPGQQPIDSKFYSNNHY